MWGDGAREYGAIGGADTFVFRGDFGSDQVNDFQPGLDKLEIDISDGVPWQDQISWENDGPLGTWLRIRLESEDSSGYIYLVGFGGYVPTESDFMFV